MKGTMNFRPGVSVLLGHDLEAAGDEDDGDDEDDDGDFHGSGSWRVWAARKGRGAVNGAKR